MPAIPSWDEVELGIGRYIKASTGLDRVRLEDQDQSPEPDLPYASWRLLSGPTRIGQVEERKTVHLMRDELQVDAAADQTYAITIDGTEEASHTASGETVAEIRDALLALLSPTSLVVESLETDKIRVTGSQTRPHFHTVTSPAADLTRTTVSEAISQGGYSPMRMTVRVNIHAPPSPASASGRAASLAASLQAGLGLPSVRAHLRAAGVAVWQVAAVADLSGLAEASPRSRAAVDLVCGVTGYLREQVPWIRTTDVSGNATAA